MRKELGEVDGVVANVVGAASTTAVAELVEVAGGLFGVIAAVGDRGISFSKSSKRKVRERVKK